jgi:hypothetical protein
MTHEDEGHYAAKHPPDYPLDPGVKEAVRRRAEKGELSCVQAHQLAKDMDVPPADVGVAADMLEIRIAKCQLGLFGYKPEKKVVRPAKEVTPEMENAIRSGLENGKLPCRTAWDIARSRKCPRMEVASACERLGIKIAPCQLGAF